MDSWLISTDKTSKMSSSSSSLVVSNPIEKDCQDLLVYWDELEQKFDPTKSGESEVMAKFESQLLLEERWTEKYMSMVEELNTLVPSSIRQRVEYVKWFIRNKPTNYVSQMSQDFSKMPLYPGPMDESICPAHETETRK